MKQVFAFLPVLYAGNQNTIEQLIHRLNSKPSTWRAGRNDNFDINKSPSEYAHLLGALEEPFPVDMGLKTEFKTKMELIPDSFDSRDKWGSICPSVLEIRDQASCGSCWAFGAASALSDRVCIASNGAFTESLSTEDVLSCCGVTCGMGCNGGYLATTWKYFQTNGICTGGLYQGTGCKPYRVVIKKFSHVYHLILAHFSKIKWT